MTDATSTGRPAEVERGPGPSPSRPGTPRRRGVCYDVGRSFGGPSTRPQLNMRVVRRELQIIRDDLHCNAVRICGTDLGRVKRTAEHALSLGLETWLCPELFEHDQPATLHYIARAARTAEALRRRSPGRVVLSVGTELTLFMHGILEGAHFTERITAPTFWEQISAQAHAAPLNAFLARASVVVRRTFKGPLTYASAPFEPVDWSIFDIACLDLYRDHTNRTRFGEQLEPGFAQGRPVVVSEVGCCTYNGAENAGGMGWAILDHSSHPPQLGGDYERDEALQARELIDMVELLEHHGADGVFVMTFVSPTLPHREDRRRDLDMASYSLVKSYEGHTGNDLPGPALGTQAILPRPRTTLRRPPSPRPCSDRPIRCTAPPRAVRNRVEEASMHQQGNPVMHRSPIWALQSSPASATVGSGPTRRSGRCAPGAHVGTDRSARETHPRRQRVHARGPGWSRSRPRTDCSFQPHHRNDVGAPRNSPLNFARRERLNTRNIHKAK